VRTPLRVLVCFVVLPVLPIAAVFLLSKTDAGLQPDTQKGLFVCLGATAALISGGLGYRPRRDGAAALGYALATAALAAVATVVLVGTFIVVACRDSSDCL
jgi:hypothetical protein